MLKKMLLGAVFAAGFATSANAVVLYTDNFDANTGGLNATPIGWNTTVGAVDIIPVGPFFNWYGSGLYIDLNGSIGQSGQIDTQATFNLVMGQSYTIDFDYGNNKNSNGNELLVFGAGSNMSSIPVNGFIASLISYSWTFVALNTETVSLFFADGGNSPGDNGGPILDNVSFSAVPLPAALPLLAAGLGVMGLVASRRKRRARRAA